MHRIWTRRGWGEYLVRVGVMLQGEGLSEGEGKSEGKVSAHTILAQMVQAQRGDEVCVPMAGMT